MAEFSGIDANKAIVKFWADHGAKLPARAREVLEDDIAQGGLIQITGMIEGLYAVRETLPPEGLELLEDLSNFVADKNFRGRGERAGHIAGVANRIKKGGKSAKHRDPKDIQQDEKYIKAPEPVGALPSTPPAPAE